MIILQHLWEFKGDLSLRDEFSLLGEVDGQ